MHITQDDQTRIAQAISRAEAATSGEIFCVVSRRVSTYDDVALAWAAAAALILPALLIPFGFDGAWPFHGGGWEAAHASGLTVGRALGAYVALQAAERGVLRVHGGGAGGGFRLCALCQIV